MSERNFDTNQYDEKRFDNSFSDTQRQFRSEASKSNRLGKFFAGENENASTRSQVYNENKQQHHSSGTVIYSPSTYEDVQLLIDHLKLREQVIVDFSNINQTSVYRILDFMSGAIYALCGSIQQISKNIFLFAPSGVTITVPPQMGRN